MEMINVVIQKYAPKNIVGHSAGAFAVAYAVWKYEPTCVEKIVLLSPLSDNRLVFDMFFNYINTNERVRDGFYAFYTKTYGDLSKLIVREFAKKIFMKALIIHDKNDEIIPESQSLEIHQSWKNSELMLTENLGHSLRHDSVYKKILEFLK